MAKLSKKLDARLDEYMLAQAATEGLIKKMYQEALSQLELDADRDLIKDFNTAYQTVLTLLDKGYLWNAVEELKTILNKYGFAHL